MAYVIIIMYHKINRLGVCLVEKTLEQKLLEYCVKYLHGLCVDNNGTIEFVLGDLGCTEFELFNGFENLSIDNGFELEEE